MYNYWGTENKVTKQGLQVQYTSNYQTKTITVGGASVTVVVYEYHRLVSKQYSFVGMNEATARKCQEMKIAQYTRIFSERNEWGQMPTTPRRVEKCIATVTPTHDDAGLWSVNISVNEDQAQNYGSFTTMPQFLFDLSIDYDEDKPDGGCLMMNGDIWLEEYATWGIGYWHLINDFTTNHLIAQVSSDGGKTWDTIAPSWVSDSAIFIPTNTYTGLMRLKYGGITSNALELPDHGATGYITLGNPSYILECWTIPFAQQYFRDFDPLNLIVEYRANSSAAWTDISANCAITDNSISTGIYTATLQGQFRARYGGVTSNVVQTPYDPSKDTGDGSLVVVGCLTSGQTYIDLDASGITGFDTSLVTVKTSTNGLDWTAQSIQSVTATDDWPVVVHLSNAVAAGTFIKVFYDGTQATGAFARPTTDGHSLVCTGYSVEGAVGTTRFVYWEAIDGFDAESLALQVSTDGGDTWTAAEGTLQQAYSYFQLATPLWPRDGVKRLYRFNYGGGEVISPVIASPLA